MRISMKKETLESAFKVNEDKMKVLTAHPLFQKIVVKMREKLNMLPNGYQTDKAAAVWRERIKRGSLKYLDSKEYKEKRKQLYCDYIDGKHSKDQYYRKLHRLNLSDPNYFWEIGIREIALNFNLGANYYHAIKEYILRNKVDWVGPNYDYHYDSAIPTEVTIKIYGNIRDIEMKEVIKRAMKLGEKSGWNIDRSFRSKKDIDQVLEILKLSELKQDKESNLKKDQDISAHMNKVPFEESGEYDKKEANRIAQIRKRFPEILDSIFPSNIETSPFLQEVLNVRSPHDKNTS